MTVKEYLSQAFSLDQRINCKLEQVARLRELAEKATQANNLGYAGKCDKKYTSYGRNDCEDD